MTVKKTTKPATKKATAATPIPSAVRAAPAVPADDVLSLINDVAGVSRHKEPPKAGKTTHPKMQLTEAAQEQFQRIAPAIIGMGFLKSYLETERGVFDEMAKDEWLRLYWQSKAKPETPEIVVRDGNRPMATGLFSFVAKYHVVPVKCKRKETPAQAYVRTLVEVCGLDEDKASELVATELTLTPNLSIYLRQGGDLDMTDDERASMIVVEPQVKVTEGFAERLCTYCDSPDQVMACLDSVFHPEWHLKSVKYFGDLLNQLGEIIKGEEQKGDKKAPKGKKVADDE